MPFIDTEIPQQVESLLVREPKLLYMINDTDADDLVPDWAQVSAAISAMRASLILTWFILPIRKSY